MVIRAVLKQYWLPKSFFWYPTTPTSPAKWRKGLRREKFSDGEVTGEVGQAGHDILCQG